MITLGVLCVFFGFYCCYNSSQRAVLSKSKFVGKYLQKKPKISKVIGSIFLFSAFVILSLELGIVKGILIGLVLVMLVFSLLILVLPLKKTI